MKKKQVIGIIAACLIIAITGLMGVRSAMVMNQLKKDGEKKALETVNDAMNTKSNKDFVEFPKSPFIAQINIVGTIQAESGRSDYMSEGNSYRHNLYMSAISKLEETDSNKGIFLYVDSPGGTVYESDELYLKLMEYKKKTGRPVYAYFASTACSGAYYISMAADRIYANRNCTTGSIGVIMSLMNYEKLLKKIGVSEVDITSGDNKTIGSGAQPMTEEQRKILQGMVDEAYQQFTDIVAKGRNMDIEKVRKLADGRVYTATQAKNQQLLDEVMGFEETKAAVATALENDQIEFYEIKRKAMWTDLFGRMNWLAEKFGKQSDVQMLKDLMDKDESGVLMYYAK